MHRRALLLAPLFALLLVSCGDKSSDTTAAGTETAVETTAVATDAPATATEAADTEPVSDTTDSTDSAPASASAPGTASFSIVSVISGTWPSPVATATNISDIDTKGLCTTLLDGKAFGDLTAEYYGGSLSLVEEQLNFQCQFRHPAESPVALDGFSDAFLAGVQADGQSLKGDENDSVGLVEITLDGDPLGSNDSGDQFIAANKGCLAGAKAVGLTGPWTSETLGSIDGNRIVTCRGPIPTGDVRTADPALVAAVVGTDAPPLD